MMAMASPRRRSNQRVALATSGAIIAALPSRPISRPFATQNPQRPSDWLATRLPRQIMTEPNRIGWRMPRLSIHQPIATPPMPVPTISSE